MAVATGASMGALTGAMKGLTISIQSSSSAFVSAGGGGSDLYCGGGSSTPAGRHGRGVVPLTIEAAHKKGAGSTKNGRDSNPKMLGVKIYGDQTAKPGAIIVRQRGTKFHPGNNVGLGRDYTIFSLIDGLVKFEKYGPDRKKVSVYPNLVEKVENPDSRRVKRREAFKAKREKRRAVQLSRLFGDAGFQLVEEGLQLASIPECDEESEETVVC